MQTTGTTSDGQRINVGGLVATLLTMHNPQQNGQITPESQMSGFRALQSATSSMNSSQFLKVVQDIYSFQNQRPEMNHHLAGLLLVYAHPPTVNPNELLQTLHPSDPAMQQGLFDAMEWARRP